MCIQHGPYYGESKAYCEHGYSTSWSSLSRLRLWLRQSCIRVRFVGLSFKLDIRQQRDLVGGGRLWPWRRTYLG